jgi:heme exporter protein A
MLQAEGLWRFFGDFAALRDVSVDVGPRECIALLGPNGAGKTTLLKLLAGLASPQKGKLTMPARRDTGYLGHGLGLYEELSALENLRFWGGVYGAPDAAPLQWLERIGLAHVADAPVRQLSRGMRQRVALGRAFQHLPRLLILDEPFTGLDRESVTLLQTLLREALDGGAGVILSSHQIPEAMSLATGTLRLEKGRVA